MEKLSTPLGLQSRFGGRLVNSEPACPQNGTAVVTKRDEGVRSSPCKASTLAYIHG